MLNQNGHFTNLKDKLVNLNSLKKSCFSFSEINTWISCKDKQSRNQKAKERGKK